jgi:hypothetical protein
VLEHVQGRFVELHKGRVVDLPQTEEVEDLADSRGVMMNTKKISTTRYLLTP